MQQNKPNSIQEDVQSALSILIQARENFTSSFTFKDFGIVDSVTTGVAFVTGLSGVAYNELLLFEGGLSGIAFKIDKESAFSLYSHF